MSAKVQTRRGFFGACVAAAAAMLLPAAKAAGVETQFHVLNLETYAYKSMKPPTLDEMLELHRAVNEMYRKLLANQS
jgi:hypothetical protein